MGCGASSSRDKPRNGAGGSASSPSRKRGSKGDSKEPKPSRKRSSGKHDPTDDPLLTGNSNNNNNNTRQTPLRNAQQGAAADRQLTAREKLVYERPGSDDGNRCDEPIAPVASIKRGIAYMKASMMDYVHSKDDVETRAAFDDHLASYRPSRKVVMRVSYWMDEVDEQKRQDDEKPKISINIVLPDAAGGVPTIPCYLDRVFADAQHAALAAGGEDGLASSTSELDTSVHCGTVMSSLRSLSSDHSILKRGGAAGIMKRSPQARPAAGGMGGAQRSFSPALPSSSPNGGFTFFDTNPDGSLADPSGAGCPNTFGSPSGAGNDNSYSKSGSSGRIQGGLNASQMDDVDALMFGVPQQQSPAGVPSPCNTSGLSPLPHLPISRTASARSASEGMQSWRPGESSVKAPESQASTCANGGAT